MIKFISNEALIKTNGYVKDIMCAYYIRNWNSELIQQHRHLFERKYQHGKHTNSKMPERACSPASIWLLVLAYVCYLLKYNASTILKWRVLVECLIHVIPYISPLLYFHWCEHV